MKKKNEVYVRVDTPKKAKKLAKVLEMFGEPVYEPTKKRLADGVISEDYPLVHLLEIPHNQWIGSIDYAYIKSEKTEVSIKELRNILAVEHLKEGDVVVCKEGEDMAVGVYKEHDAFGFDLEPCYYNDGTHSGGCFDTFIRYATEEEKALLKPKPKELTREDVEKEVVGYATDNDWDKDKMVEYIAEPSVGLCFEKYMLLEGYGANERADIIIKKYKPKPELELGKWYKYPHIENWKLCITYVGSTAVKGYGLDTQEGWMTDWKGEINADSLKDLVECSPQEVEHALIKEAKKRYKVGDEVSRLEGYYYGDSNGILENLDFFWKNGRIIANTGDGYYHCIFKDGKWAEVVKEAPNFEVEVDIAKEELDRKVEELQASLNSKVGNYQGVKSKLYYKYNSECQLVFMRSAVSPMHGDWNLYGGKDINELI